MIFYISRVGVLGGTLTFDSYDVSSNFLHIFFKILKAFECPTNFNIHIRKHAIKHFAHYTEKHKQTSTIKNTRFKR